MVYKLWLGRFNGTSGGCSAVAMVLQVFAGVFIQNKVGFRKFSAAKREQTLEKSYLRNVLN